MMNDPAIPFSPAAPATTERPEAILYLDMARSQLFFFARAWRDGLASKEQLIAAIGICEHADAHFFAAFAALDAPKRAPEDAYALKVPVLSEKAPA